jgi:hypothetical protein
MDMSAPYSEANPQRLYAWKAPLRAYKKRSAKIMRFYAAVAILLTLIVFFFGDRILIIPILTLLFLFYVLTVTPPPEVEHVITTFGIETAGISLRWEFLSHFHFTKKFGFDMLTVVSHAPYFYHVYMIVPDEETKKKVMGLLSKHIMFMEKPTRTITDKMVDFLSNLLPDDEEEKNKVTPPASLHQKPMPASL